MNIRGWWEVWPSLGVESLFCPLLSTIPGPHRCVIVKRIVIHVKVIYEPLVQRGNYPLVNPLVKLLVVMPESPVARYTTPLK